MSSDNNGDRRPCGVFNQELKLETIEGDKCTDMKSDVHVAPMIDGKERGELIKGRKDKIIFGNN